MAGATFTLTIDDGEIFAGMAAIRGLSADLRPTMDRIGMALESSTIDRFDKGVSPDGVAWPASERVLLAGGKTLVDRGHLRGSITHNADGSSVEVGSNLVYAAVHQAGFDGPVVVKAHSRAFKMVFGHPYSGVAEVRSHQRKMNMPARPFLGLSVDDRLDVVAIVQDDYADAVARVAQ